MLTKNFYNALVSRFAYASLSGALVDPTGASHNANKPGSSSNDTFLRNMRSLTLTSGSTSGVLIGSGVTPSTPDDYKIENQITSGLSVINPGEPSVNRESDHVAVSATYGITNTGTVGQTISEICLFGPIYSSNSNTTNCLIDRTVLEKPIIINPGESKQVTYTIRFNYPTE